jgi:hypothetical protein
LIARGLQTSLPFGMMLRQIGPRDLACAHQQAEEVAK